MSRTSKFFRDIAGAVFGSLTKAGRADRSAAKARPSGQTPGPTGRPSVRTSSSPAPGRTPAPVRPSATSGPRTPASTTQGRQSSTPTGNETGRFGSTATVEVDPARVGRVTMTYSPSVDGDPDPGEIVWTWVPFEENDGRGKDRPVLVVARLTNDSVLAVQLTSKSHDGNREFVAIGAGPWDAENRPSWVNLDRVFQVHPDGMRREAASLDKARFDRVKSALTTRYRWS